MHHGGTVGDVFTANDGSRVYLFGSEFSIDGTQLNSLALDLSFPINNRGGEVLSGTLADGSTFSFDLNGTGVVGEDSFAPISLFVVLTAPTFTLGDVSGDGVVDFLDISPFIAILAAGGFQDEADIDRNEVVNFLDIAPFIATLSGQ